MTGKDLPDGWALRPLSELGTWTSGGTPSRKDPGAYGGDIPWIKIGDLQDGPVHAVEESITQHGLERSSAVMLGAGQLLVAMYGASIGKLGTTVGPCTTNQAIAACDPNESIELGYLTYSLLHQKRKLVAKGQGGAQPNISQRILKAHEIAVPHKLSTQREVVDKIDQLFSRIDEGERALRTVETLVERYRQSVLKAAVTGELTRDWRAANRERLEAEGDTGQALLDRILTARREAWETAELEKLTAKGKPPKTDAWKAKYKEPVAPDTDGLPELPEGWVWATLDQLAWQTSYGTSAKCAVDSAGTPVLRIPNIRSGLVTLDDLKFSTKDLALLPSDPLAKGDLLVIRTNGSESLIGTGAVLNSALPRDHYFASYLIRFRLIESVAGWVGLVWPSHVVRQFVAQNRGSSAGQYNISQSSLRGLVLPVPPVQEMERLSTVADLRLREGFEAAKGIAAQHTKSSALRQAVLAMAFSGNLSESIT